MGHRAVFLFVCFAHFTSFGYKSPVIVVENSKKYHWIQHKKKHHFITSERNNGLRTREASQLIINKQNVSNGDEKLQKIPLDST